MRHAIILLIFLLIPLGMTAYKPSDYRILEGTGIQDTYQMRELIGQTFIICNGSPNSGRYGLDYSEFFSYLEPDTIVVRHNKKGMEEGTDFFVIKDYGAVLQVRNKGSHSSFRFFNPASYSEKKFRSFEFRVCRGWETKYLYERQFSLLDVIKEQNICKYVLEDLTTGKKVLFAPELEKIYLMPLEIKSIIDSSLPDTLYDKFDSHPSKYLKSKVVVACLLNCGALNVDLEIKYKEGSWGYDNDIKSSNKYVTKAEYEAFNRDYTINYLVDTSYVEPRELVEYVAGENRTGFLINFKGGSVGQTVRKGKIISSVYANSGLLWFAGLDTINGNVYFRVCENDKVFYVPENYISLTYEAGELFRSSAEKVQRYQTLSLDDKEKYFEYTKNFVCHTLHKEHICEYEKYINEYEKIGFMIDEISIYDNYGVTTGLSFTITNMSFKTIKYVEISVTGLNPVGDKVMSGGKYVQVAKGIGPIEPYQRVSYDFEYLWNTDLVEHFSINSYTITYMDGSKKVVGKNENPRKRLAFEVAEEKLNYLPKLKSSYK